MAEATHAMTVTISANVEARFDTITLNNGTEFHDYETVEDRAGVEFYFATPYHSLGSRNQ